MKIAIVAPIEETVPPLKYGGTEWIVYHVANGLGKKGHEVHLFAAGDSPTSPHYKLIPTVEKSIRTLPEYMDNVHLRDTKKLSILAPLVKKINEGNYDIVHNHMSWRFLLYADLVTPPVVTTHHSPLSPDYQKMVFLQHVHRPYVSISNNQRKDLSELNYVATIYNGTDIDLFPYTSIIPSAEQYMAFLARLSPEKGAIEAAQVAHKVKKTLRVASKVDAVDKPNFEIFKEYIDNKYVMFEEEVGHDIKLNLLQNARCLLVPIKWEEPFGLMFTEAMACGTPVVTFARGSAPEIIKDGVTGFLVNESDEDRRGDFIVKKTGIEGLCEAVDKIYSMSDAEYAQMRLAARKQVEDNFTVEKMVNQYEEVFKKIIG